MQVPLCGQNGLMASSFDDQICAGVDSTPGHPNLGSTETSENFEAPTIRRDIDLDDPNSVGTPSAMTLDLVEEPQTSSPRRRFRTSGRVELTLRRTKPGARIRRFTTTAGIARPRMRPRGLY